jgi:hypothetical protein
MPIRKKQKGGIIDNPKNCNNDTTPVYLDDITNDINVIYVGDKLAGDKYNCFKPEELKEIIKTAFNNGENPRDPLTRKVLSEELINRITNMYPEEFEDFVEYEDEDDDEDDDDDEEDDEEEEELEEIDYEAEEKEESEVGFILRVNRSVGQIIPVLLNEEYRTIPGDDEHEDRIEPLQRLLAKYDTPNEIGMKWEQWYNNPNLSMEYKDAMINLFSIIDSLDDKYIEFAYNMISIELLELIRFPGASRNIEFKFHYIKAKEEIEAIAVTYIMDEDESNERLEDFLNIENLDNWNVYKLCIFATLPYEEDEQKLQSERFIDFILESDNRNKLVSLMYESDVDTDEYTKYVFDILDFYTIDKNNMSDDMAEIYSTYGSLNNKLYLEKSGIDGGSKKKKSRKVVYKKRNKIQNGGIINDPKRCNNDSTPIDLDEIKEDSNVIYVGDKLAGDKYNCFKPEELKEIILQAIKERKYPQNPLNRENLSEELIERIVAMYPADFEEDEEDEDDEDDEDEEPELILRANLSLETITPILVDQYSVPEEGAEVDPRRQGRYGRILRELLRKLYNNDDNWNKWYNNTDISRTHKYAMVNYFKLVDSFPPSISDINNNLITVELMDLLNSPIEDDIDFRFHYLYRDYPNIRYVVGIIITYELDEDESLERLEELNIQNTDEWSVYKICGMALEGEFSNSKENMNDLLTKILDYDENNKLLIVTYDSDHSNPGDNYSKFVFDTLDFYQVGDYDNKKGMSYNYAEAYSTYDSDDNKLYIGKYENVGGSRKKKSKKVVYRKRVSKKKTSKKKSKKSSKKRSHHRRK